MLELGVAAVVTKASDWRWFNLRIDEIKDVLEAIDESQK